MSSRYIIKKAFKIIKWIQCQGHLKKAMLLEVDFCIVRESTFSIPIDIYNYYNNPYNYQLDSVAQ